MDVPAWQYDDYKAISNVQSVDGALELTEIGGVTYVHAKGIGAGTIVCTDHTETITVEKAILDVYYLNGQSNATYMPSTAQTNPEEAEPYPGLGQGYFVNALSGWASRVAWYDSEGNKNVGNISPSFVADYYESTGHKVLFIQGGVAGRSILKFQPGEEMYNRTTGVMEMNYTSGLLSQTDKYNINTVAMIWIQGEADANSMTSEEYLGYFLTFWESYQTTAHPFDYCLISIMPETFPTIRSADFKLIESRGDMYLGADVTKTFTIENGLMASDDLHYTQKGRNLLGETLADNAEYYLTHQKTDYYNGQYETLINIIPLMFLVSCVVGIVALMIRARD